MNIIVDKREDQLYFLLSELVNEKSPPRIKIISQSIHAGDVCIRFSNINLLLMERKTWADLAHCVSDGSYQGQLNEILILRSKKEFSQCQFLYLIEGKNYNCTTRIPRTKYQSGQLLEVLISTLLTHQINYLVIPDIQSTAEMILRFCDLLAKKTLEADVFENTINLTASTYEKVDTRGNKSIAKDLNSEIVGFQKRRRKSKNEILKKIWSAIPGITLFKADIYSKTLTILDLFLPDALSKLSSLSYRTAKGRVLRVDETKALKIIQSLRITKVQSGIIAGVPLIGKATAEKIIANCRLPKIMELIKRGEDLKLQLTPKKEENIRFYLTAIMD